jgi:phage tail sheath protein FI
MATYKTPGVYVEEISKLPPSVAEVETAIPAFIGYTKNVEYNGLPLVNKPKRIKSLAEYVEIFGKAQPVKLVTTGDSGIKITKSGNELIPEGKLKNPIEDLYYRMYYSLQLYFGNGGGPCYIVSCGGYAADNVAEKVKKDDMSQALNALKKEDEPTMILFTDAFALANESDFYDLYKLALQQSSDLMDRVTVVDLYLAASKKGEAKFNDISAAFRTNIGNLSLSYGAAYYPWLRTSLEYFIDESAVSIVKGTNITTEIKDNTVLRKFPAEGATEVTTGEAETSLYHYQSSLYSLIKKEIDKFRVISPPGPAIAGVYAAVDSARGVWKAPANVSLRFVKEPMVKIDDEDQRDMNVTDSGKSVNAIRTFTGKGVMVWGARTLAGNDNEWRYISVRRFYNMVEESVKKATEPFVFEPNDKNTWIKVKAMIENYLVLKWRDGALMGAKPDEAFFVHVGLGETMTALDILEGRMIVEIGMAVVRPAEFIILRFSHKMVVS